LPFEAPGRVAKLRQKIEACVDGGSGFHHHHHHHRHIRLHHKHFTLQDSCALYSPVNLQECWNALPAFRVRARTPPGRRRRTDAIKELKTDLNAVQFFENVPGELPGSMAERIAEAGFS